MGAASFNLRAMSWAPGRGAGVDEVVVDEVVVVDEEVVDEVVAAVAGEEEAMPSLAAFTPPLRTDPDCTPAGVVR